MTGQQKDEHAQKNHSLMWSLSWILSVFTKKNNFPLKKSCYLMFVDLWITRYFFHQWIQNVCISFAFQFSLPDFWLKLSTSVVISLRTIINTLCWRSSQDNRNETDLSSFKNIILLLKLYFHKLAKNGEKRKNDGK